MKYFTKELWDQLQIPETQSQATLEWDKNRKKYWEIFEVVKSRLSKKFLDLYSKNDGFHDFHLTNLIVNNDEGKEQPSIEMNISEFGKMYRLLYKGVKHSESNMQKRVGPDLMIGATANSCLLMMNT